ncbi:MAG: hypothetical protein EKK52_18535 [Burkholderiales bacterium]|nr:MAG: hypothetical protein EKK52_18535 [Burkholderiales bacterium]
MPAAGLAAAAGAAAAGAGVAATTGTGAGAGAGVGAGARGVALQPASTGPINQRAARLKRSIADMGLSSSGSLASWALSCSSLSAAAAVCLQRPVTRSTSVSRASSARLRVASLRAVCGVRCAVCGAR